MPEVDPKPTVGDHVRYCDERGVHHHALVQAVWEKEYEGKPVPIGLNLVYISTNVAEMDQYGRQIKHAASVIHKSGQSAPANYWY